MYDKYTHRNTSENFRMVQTMLRLNNLIDV